jgi:hypothetical protein
MKTKKIFRHISRPLAVESAAVSVVNKFPMTAYNERGRKNTALRPCRFTLEETANGAHKTRSLVGP